MVSNGTISHLNFEYFQGKNTRIIARPLSQLKSGPSYLHPIFSKPRRLYNPQTNQNKTMQEIKYCQNYIGPILPSCCTQQVRQQCWRTCSGFVLVCQQTLESNFATNPSLWIVTNEQVKYSRRIFVTVSCHYTKSNATKYQCRPM